MDDYISRQWLMECVNGIKFETEKDENIIIHLVRDIAPSVQTERHGHWIESDTDGFVCSICQNGYRNQPTLMGEPMFEYCPVCGARMDEVK